MEEAAEELLVAVNEGVKLMWKCKDHMKVRDVDDLGPAPVHPDFLKEGLAVRAVPVAARIIVEIHVSALGALADITTEFSGFAV